jgi:nucleoside-diphosphate-sugar epimerase
MSAVESDAKATSNNKTVAVTGANGFIASALIDQLVARGYKVRATVRDPTNTEKCGFFKTDYPTVELFKADLLEEGSFDACFAGCSVVFHTASPFFVDNIVDAQKQLVDPAVKGTTNVINSALKVDSVSRIVVTSSVAAIKRSDKPEDYKFTEADWNESATIEADPYSLSKKLAEEKAWEMIKAHQANGGKKTLVTVNPSFVLGPPIVKRTASTSINTIKKLLNNEFKDGAPARQVPYCDLGDVVRTHILVAENPDASGRYLVSHPHTGPYAKLGQILKEQFPNMDICTTTAPPAKFNFGITLDGSKVVRELGLQYTPLETSLKLMAERLGELGLVQLK